MKAAPVRFLLAVLLLWAGVRAAILLPDWSGGLAPVPTATAAPVRVAGPAPSTMPVAAAAMPDPARISMRGQPSSAEIRARPQPILLAATPGLAVRMPSPAPRIGRPGLPAAAPPPALIPTPLSLPARTGPSRWSLSAWLLVRDESRGPALAPGGTLGGSQAGARLTFALGGGVALSGRAYLPLRETAAAELAAGIDWRPLPSLPVNLLAERRQRLARDGRSAIALALYGGASRALTPRTRLDVYGQAGVVGLRSRDLFVDGSVRLGRRIGPVELGPIEIGGAAWGAAQPGAARLDAGPSLSWRLPVRGANLRLQADWRVRLAGDAAPGSGPTLTLAADF
ncbi:MAG TPA: hypothetical protein VEC11_07855 [Allosphingosinicella sp.]|nr:hypothetical protein [Allosphingosinicella sp.]